MKVKLSSSIDVEALINLLADKKQKELAFFVYERFSERYISPIKQLDSKERHGFSMMAVACLMIEAYESFYNGWTSTERKSRTAFKSFFERESEFKDFEKYSDEFYKNIRCGILHQAETTSGWKILRKGNLLDIQNKTINATEFIQRLDSTIKNYSYNLEVESWESEIWQNLRIKLRALIQNCI